MTSTPADQLKQYDLGRIQPSAYADLIVFDEHLIQDKATYTNSRQFAEGIEYMVLNGTFVIQEGKLSGKTPGRWLRPKSQE